MAIAFFSVPFAKVFGHDGGATGAEHEAHGGQDHKKRHDQIDCRKGSFPRKIGHEKAVNHTVYGSADHHTDGRQRKAEQTSVCEVIR